MAYETKPNTGALFKNDRREKDSHPNAKGSALIEGVEYWVSSWTNEDRNGNKYQSLKFERKTGADGRGERRRGYDEPEGRGHAQQHGPEPGSVTQGPPLREQLDDDIPF